MRLSLLTKLANLIAHSLSQNPRFVDAVAKSLVTQHGEDAIKVLHEAHLSSEEIATLKSGQLPSSFIKDHNIDPNKLLLALNNPDLDNYRLIESLVSDSGLAIHNHYDVKGQKFVSDITNISILRQLLVRDVTKDIDTLSPDDHLYSYGHPEEIIRSAIRIYKGERIEDLKTGDISGLLKDGSKWLRLFSNLKSIANFPPKHIKLIDTSPPGSLFRTVTEVEFDPKKNSIR